MMKFGVILFLVLSASVAFGQKFNARLCNIRYYDDGKNVEFPILVKICFATNSNNPKSLTFVSRYSSVVTSRTAVHEYDSAFVYYTFRTEINKQSSLDLWIEDKNGISCPVYTINALPTNENVIKTIEK